MNVIQDFTEWRKVQKYSLSEVARQINVNKGTLSQIEHGERKCPQQILGKIIQTLNSAPLHNGNLGHF